MKNTNWKKFGVFVFALAAQRGVALAQHHDDDFVVGCTGAGQLAVEFDFDENPVLPPVQGLLNGFALDEPGFMALGEDKPTEDFFTLADGASIVFEAVSFSPVLSAWTPGFLSQLDQPGEQWVLGGTSFDEHLTWHIDANHPSFDPVAGPWSATFRLLDLGTTGYAASPDYTVHFVPEPGVLALVTIATLPLLWRRQEH